MRALRRCLLLDEIAAHLDEPRRAALFEEIERLGAQAWMTGTDSEVFLSLQEKAEFLNVAEGAITHIGKRCRPASCYANEIELG